MSMDDLKPTDDKSAEEDPAKALEADMKASKK
jgi:hypothetical protein